MEITHLKIPSPPGAQARAVATPNPAAQGRFYAGTGAPATASSSSEDERSLPPGVVRATPLPQPPAERAQDEGGEHVGG